MTKEYLPESEYKLDSALTRKSLKKGDIVTGKVTSIVQSKQFLIVDLGSVKAHLPFEDCSIYTSQIRKGYIDPNIFYLLGSIIRAKVVRVEGTIMLSRKKFMEEALNYLKTTPQSDFKVTITAFNQFSAFVDIGSGIHGRIIAPDFTKAYIRDIQDVGLKIGDSFMAKKICYNEELKSFDLSRVAAIAEEPHNLQRDNYVEFKVFKALKDGCGYLGLIDKKYPALLDSRNVTLQYGDEVIGIVKEVTPKGIKLKFDSFVCNFDDIS